MGILPRQRSRKEASSVAHARRISLAHILSLSHPPRHDFNSLFLFSLLFTRSTLFRCIRSAIFSYRSLSSFAARFSRMACIRRYFSIPQPHTLAGDSRFSIFAPDKKHSRVEDAIACMCVCTYLSLPLLLILHFSLRLFHSCEGSALCQAFRV